MFRYFLLLCTLYLSTFDEVYSQNDFRWAVGPDLLSLVNQNVTPKYSLYARYKIGENGAIRVRPGYYNVKGQPEFFNLKEQKTYGIRIGYERTNALYKKCLYLLYGAEYVYFNDHQFSFDYSNPTNQQSFLVADHKENGGAVFISLYQTCLFQLNQHFKLLKLVW
jgi:hypothetical protein